MPHLTLYKLRGFLHVTVFTFIRWAVLETNVCYKPTQVLQGPRDQSLENCIHNEPPCPSLTCCCKSQRAYHPWLLLMEAIWGWRAAEGPLLTEALCGRSCKEKTGIVKINLAENLTIKTGFKGVCRLRWCSTKTMFENQQGQGMFTYILAIFVQVGAPSLRRVKCDYRRALFST